MSVKKQSIALIPLLLLITFINPSKASAPPKKPAYKAQNAEECIQEKECAWYAFGLQMGIFDYVQWVKVGKGLHKWGQVLRVATGGQAQNYLPQFVKVSEQLGPYIKHGMIADFKTPQYIVIFTDDVDRVFNLWEERLDNRLGQGKSRFLFNIMKRDNRSCLSFQTRDKITLDISSVFTLVDTTSPEAEYCMAVNFYDALGLYGYLETQPFSFLSNKNHEEIKFTDLDLFLLFLLYQPEFKSGMSAKEVRSVFMEIYDRAKTDFMKQNKKNP